MSDRAEALAKVLEALLAGDQNVIEDCHGWREVANAKDALEAYRSQPDGWVSVEERMPEPGTECLVWVVSSPWAQPGTHYAALDTWDEQHEAPLSFSSATIPIGLGWGDHEYEDITHWQPIPAPPNSKEQQ